MSWSSPVGSFKQRVIRVEKRQWRWDTNEYVSATVIMTLRIDPGLAVALRQRANREGHSVSAEVIRMIRKEVEPGPTPRRRVSPTMGMFADFEARELKELKRLRREISTALLWRVGPSKRPA